MAQPPGTRPAGEAGRGTPLGRVDVDGERDQTEAGADVQRHAILAPFFAADGEVAPEPAQPPAADDGAPGRGSGLDRETGGGDDALAELRQPRRGVGNQGDVVGGGRAAADQQAGSRPKVHGADGTIGGNEHRDKVGDADGGEGGG